MASVSNRHANRALQIRMIRILIFQYSSLCLQLLVLSTPNRHFFDLCMQSGSLCANRNLIIPAGFPVKGCLCQNTISIFIFQECNFRIRKECNGVGTDRPLYAHIYHIVFACQGSHFKYRRIVFPVISAGIRFSKICTGQMQCSLIQIQMSLQSGKLADLFM